MTWACECGSVVYAPPLSAAYAIIPSTVRTHGDPGESCDGFHSWVTENHGVYAGQSYLQIAAQGITDKPVLIQKMRVRIIASSAPLTGIAVQCHGQGRAELREIAINLDATPPTVDYKSDSNAPFGFTLAKGETESFIVTATAAKATYRWKILFDVVVNGAATTLEVGGKDGFTTTAPPATVWDAWGPRAWDWNHFDHDWELFDGPDNVRKVPTSEPLPATS
jgi:hypothetical protein